jgi:hypothetical protein
LGDDSAGADFLPGDLRVRVEVAAQCGEFVLKGSGAGEGIGHRRVWTSGGPPTVFREGGVTWIHGRLYPL